MARFLGVAVQTDILVTVPVGTTPARVAFFRPDELAMCVAIQSPSEPESLTVQVERDDPRCAEIVEGRVLRVVHEGGTGDTEWDIADVDDASSADVLTITCDPIALRLARVVYMGVTSTTGQPAPDWTGVQQTAEEWLDALVIPTLAEAGMAFEVGTIDSTARFTMDGEWNSVLEIINAICEPGRANAEFRLSAGGDYGYVIDLLDAIGSSAATVRVRTAINLIETKRNRSMRTVATRLFARGSPDSVATRTMGEHVFAIASVVSGTVLELEDPFGGDGPIAYDDQLNGMRVAVMNSPTFADQAVSDSVASTQRITVASTAGMSAGEWLRFFRTTGEAGTRVTSLTRPLLVDHPADGGYGDRAAILDRPGIVADTNLIPNAMMRAWANISDPPDGWERFADDDTETGFTQELNDGPADGVPSYLFALPDTGEVTVFGAFTGTAQEPAVTIKSPLAYPWESITAGLREYVATVWIKVTTAPTGLKLYLYLKNEAEADTTQPDSVAHPIQIGTWVEGTDDEDVWIRYESAVTPALLNFLAGGVRVVVEVAHSDNDNYTDAAGAWKGRWDNGTAYLDGEYVSHENVVYVANANHTGSEPPSLNWDSITSTLNRRVPPGVELAVSAVTLAEAPSAIADREGSGGTELWQEANRLLPILSSPVKGYDLTVADLAADDATTYATLAFTPGGTVEITDLDLDLVTSLRLVEYTRDYLRPLDSRIRVGDPPDRVTDALEATRLATLGTIS